MDTGGISFVSTLEILEDESERLQHNVARRHRLGSHVHADREKFRQEDAHIWIAGPNRTKERNVRP